MCHIHGGLPLLRLRPSETIPRARDHRDNCTYMPPLGIVVHGTHSITDVTAKRERAATNVDRAAVQQLPLDSRGDICARVYTRIL